MTVSHNAKAKHMYIPKHFSNADRSLAQNVVRDYPFAVLISHEEHMPITHLPLIWLDDATPHGTVLGHLAKPNEQGKILDGQTPATAIFTGPHAYVSPNWYVSANMVPTWNYAAVHLHGCPQAVTDPAHATDIMERLVAAFESDASGNWDTTKLLPGRMEGQLKGIVAFEMPVLEVEAKFKMSQNRPDADVKSVIAALSGHDSVLNRETARLMDELSDPSEKES